MNRRFAVLVVALLMAAFAGHAVAAPGAYHVDKETGYKVRTPKGWESIPIKNTERWIVAKFLSDREYTGKDDSGQLAMYKPHMRVIIFPKVNTADAKEKLKNPYKNFTDYLKKEYYGGGWFESLREEKQKKDLKWTLVEIKVEKLTWGGKKRLIAGIFHHEDGDYVVQFEILEDSYKKLKNDCYGCLKSFQFIARTGSIGRTTTEGAAEFVDEDKLTPAERKKRRLAKQEGAFKKSVSKLPKGWGSFEYKGVFVLHHTDKKYAMKIAKRVVAVKGWLDKNLDYLGDEFVRPMIVRVCKSRDEVNSYADTSADAWFNAESEIVTYEDKSAGSRSWAFELVVRGALRAWLADKNYDLYMATPAWFDYGLQQYLGTATVKGSRLAFKPDEWEMTRLREQKQADELQRIDDMAQMPWREYKFTYQAQSAQLLRFLFDGPGRGLKGAKTFLKDYLTAIIEMLDEREKARKAKEKEEEGAEAEPDKPKTEEEEAEEFQKRREEWRKKEKEMLEEAFQRAFSAWKKSTWETMEKSFQKFMK